MNLRGLEAVLKKTLLIAWLLAKTSLQAILKRQNLVKKV